MSFASLSLYSHLYLVIICSFVWCYVFVVLPVLVWDKYKSNQNGALMDSNSIRPCLCFKRQEKSFVFGRKGKEQTERRKVLTGYNCPFKRYYLIILQRNETRQIF